MTKSLVHWTSGKQDILYRDFKKILNTVLQNVLIDRLVKYRLGKRAERQSENCLNSWAQRIVISCVLLTRGRPQGLILRPILFEIFINDLDDVSEYTLSKSAEVIDALDDIQRDLERLRKWAERNPMKFNKVKCQALLLWRNNILHQSRQLGVNHLESSFSEKALMILVDRKVNMSQ